MAFEIREQPMEHIDLDHNKYPHLKTVTSWYLVYDRIVFWTSKTPKYIVYMSRPGKFTHMRVKRWDKQPVHNYMDLQEIKNTLMGKNATAIEVYPPDDDFVNGSNTYHLWSWQGMEVPNLPELYEYLK